ncbi:hypothetical protein [Streptomyces soliscabiei]|uniref:hypothetical protein n=1 Tax=Streptomyces soliscabiei TaxID=588897 RepID=UPI0029A8D5A6|nr:hypothetical protein [Streptomyces sp. NY05-11A]MDX2683686.1 hypothetical protein [Streptomyces sp. NY05-11A]
MRGRRPAVTPADCRTCLRAAGISVAAHAAGELLTTVEFARRLGISPRDLNRHLTDLVTHGWLREDRRTPVPGAMARKGGEVPPDADPVMWAANQAAPDRTCDLLLGTLARKAGGRWAGQITMAELAVDANMGLRTVERHRPHLGPRKARDAAGAVRAGLVEFTAVTVLSSNGRHRVRNGDRFRFLAARTAPVPSWNPSQSLVDPRPFEDTARALVDSVRWFTPDRLADYGQAVRRVSLLLARGHSPAELHQALTSRTPDDPSIPPYRLLSAWLPSLDDAPVIPAEMAVTRHLPLVPCAGACDRAIRAEHGSMCAECRALDAAGLLRVPA